MHKLTKYRRFSRDSLESYVRFFFLKSHVTVGKTERFFKSFVRGAPVDL